MNTRSITPLPPADFTPEMGNYRTLQPFRYWCQKVLPLVYDDSLSYYELLCKVVDYLNKTMEDVETLYGDVTNLHTAYEQLQNYVNNYFSSLDVQQEINNKLDKMASDGTLYDIIRKYTDPIVNEQNNKIEVLEGRMDAFASLKEGSTTGDAELQDIRVGYNGVRYPNAGDAVREQVSVIENQISEISDDVIIIDQSNQLFDWKNANIHGLYGSEGAFLKREDMSGMYIPVKPNTSYTISGTYTFSACLTIGKQWLVSYENTSNPYTLVTPSNAAYLYVSSGNNYDNHSQIIVNEGTSALPREGYYKYVYAKTYDNKIYTLPYVFKRKVICNKTKDNQTATYMGVNCENTIKILSGSFIWEKGNISGVAAFIINKNGCDRISDITDLSIHLVVTNAHIKLDILGQKLGTYYYQTLINEDITEMVLDGITTHTVVIEVIPNQNIIRVYVDGVMYNGTFTPDDNISSLNDVVGKYAVFEHYCDGDRDNVSMPMFTYFYASDFNNNIQLKDSFIRENGILCNSPQGKPYHLFSNVYNIDN